MSIRAMPTASQRLRLASSLGNHVRFRLFNYLPKLSDLLLKNCKRMFKIVEIVKNTCVKRYKRALMLQWSQTLCSDSQKRLHFPITNQFSFWWYAGIMPYSLLFQAFCTLTSIGLQRFLLKSGRSLWKHETIQSCEAVLHNRPATFKRSVYT